MKSLLTIAIVIAGIAFSQDTADMPRQESVCGEEDPCSLEGNPTVSVLIETPPEDHRRMGLSKKQLQTEVELLLRKFDVPITKSEIRDVTWREARNRLTFYVRVVGAEVKWAGGERTGAYYYSTRCEVHQKVRLGRDLAIVVTDAVTWGTSNTVGLAPKGSMRTPKDIITNAVKDQTKQFINAYLEANPK